MSALFACTSSSVGNY
nr:unnamed protein product [Callosobruchus analis]